MAAMLSLMPDELGSLRREVEMLLAGALRHDVQHLAEMERRDEQHMHELARRDELHLAETAARDRAYLDETAAHDDAHLRDLRTRSDFNAQQLENLRLALQSRDLMGQAKGVIMASMGCSANDAFQLIVKQSQHENLKATEVAAEIVQRAASRRVRTGSTGTPDAASGVHSTSP